MPVMWYKMRRSADIRFKRKSRRSEDAPRIGRDNGWPIWAGLFTNVLGRLLGIVARGSGQSSDAFFFRQDQPVKDRLGIDYWLNTTIVSFCTLKHEPFGACGRR
jgi:hypothetical protein